VGLIGGNVPLPIAREVHRLLPLHRQSGNPIGLIAIRGAAMILAQGQNPKLGPHIRANEL